MPNSMLKRLVIACLVCAMFTGLASCGDSVDERIGQYRGADDRVVGLRSMSDVIDALGEPDEVWGSSVGAEIVFIYEGRETYSVLFMASRFPMRIIQGRLGGEGAVPINVPLDFRVRGNRIEVQRR